MRHRPDFTWSGVHTECYKPPDGTWAEVIRRTLVGNRGEAAQFHLRYFEIAGGGHTTLERHGHEHVVVVLRGRGRCLVRRRSYALGFLDVLYIPPHAPHRLENPTDEPFGFLCAVDAERDTPEPLPIGDSP
jgi:ribulose-bisphosphate carboxylase large chain